MQGEGPQLQNKEKLDKKPNIQNYQGTTLNRKRHWVPQMKVTYDTG